MPAQTVIKLRRDTSANWESVDPTLAAGEIAYDTTAMKFKVGDGTSAWTVLEYSSDPESVVAGLESFASGVAATAESNAISSANSYSDSLAENYDPAGSAAAALDSAETYADGAASSAVTTHNDDTTSVHGIADTSLLLTTAGGTLTGPLTLSGAPTTDDQAATKQYVDNLAAGINFHEAVHSSSINNLNVIYNNGSSGVGATLTADTNRAFSVLDGESVVVGQRVLIKNQTDQKQNGIYTLTVNGSGSTPWVLTRATDADNNPSGEMKNGDFVFVTNGVTNAGYGFVNNSTDNPIVIGTSNITYSQFNAAKTVIAGNGLQEATPGVFSIDETITATKSYVDTEISGIDALPSQTGNTGKYLTTDGTNPSWATVDVSGKVSQTNGTVTTATPSSAVVRNITLSLSQPSGGMDGDVWMVYS